MKNALIAAGLVLAGLVMVPSAAFAMCVGAGNRCADTIGNSGYQQYQPYGQQSGNRSRQPQAITFPTHNTTFPSYMPGTQYGAQQYQYGYQQYPYNYGYQNAAYYYPTQPMYNTYNYGYEEYYEDYYEQSYGYAYGQQYGSQSWLDCGYRHSNYECY